MSVHPEEKEGDHEEGGRIHPDRGEGGSHEVLCLGDVLKHPRDNGSRSVPVEVGERHLLKVGIEILPEIEDDLVSKSVCHEGSKVGDDGPGNVENDEKNYGGVKASEIFRGEDIVHHILQNPGKEDGEVIFQKPEGG